MKLILLTFLIGVGLTEVAAQNLAIKQCGDTANTKALPSSWPCEVREIGAGIACPVGFTPCLIRTEAEFAAYKAARQSQMDTWTAANPEPSPRPALEDRIRALEVKTGIVPP